MLVLPHLVAVHDSKTGEALWQLEHDIDPLSCSSLFITRKVAGFKLRDHSCKTSTIKVFNTQNGELITDHKVTTQHLRSAKIIIARDSCLCYVDGLVIHVLMVHDNGVKKYSFTFPVDHFAKSNCFNSKDDPSKLESIILEGFVGKSKVLIGNLWSSYGCSRILMSLDIDAAVLAKNEDEVKMAFSLPLNPKGQKPPGRNNNTYLPVYRTDRINECVDLVGVMQRKEKTAKITLETHYFVTQLDPPKNIQSDFLHCQ